MFTFKQILITLVLVSTAFVQISAQVEQKVTVKYTKKGLLEISNGLLGIQLFFGENAELKGIDYSPIQAVVYADGAVSDNTLNKLESPTPVVSFDAKYLKKSNDEVEVLLIYRFHKRKYEYGGLKFADSDSGPGFYGCKIQIKRGSKSILIVEETNYDISHSFKISNGLSPTQARYRGWASSGVSEGYDEEGKLYTSYESRGGNQSDATVDLNFEKKKKYPRLFLWEPAGGEINSGRYWQIYNANASLNSNLIGFYQGQPKYLLGANHNGPSLLLLPEDPISKDKNVAEIYTNIERRAPDNVWTPRKRYQWAIFISNKKSLKQVNQYQDIGRELNYNSGLGSVIQGYMDRPAKISSNFYNGSLFQNSSEIQTLISKIKSDNNYYNFLCQSEARYKQIWDAWRYTDSAISLKEFLFRTYDKLLAQYKTGEGTYEMDYRYWKGAFNFKYFALYISALFADKSNLFTVVEKRKLELLIAGMARIVWDDNNVPLFDSAGVNLGPANMPYQYKYNGRIFFALLLASDPEFSVRAKNLVKEIADDLGKVIYTNGSNFSSPHYTQATLDPILFAALQLKQAGVNDLFKSDARIVKYAHFYKSLLTPPSVRFSGNRKIISFGDGSEESVSTFGLLATGFKDIDPALSAELNAIYNFGPPRFSFAGPMALASNNPLSGSRSLSAGNGNFSGVVSVFRNAVNTNTESAAWVLNGDSLFDHRHDDAGAFAIYALGAPLSLSSSSFYYPSASDARIRAVVVPEQLFPEWKSTDQPIAERSLTNRTWPVSANTDFVNFGDLSTTTVRMEGKNNVTWIRQFTSFSWGKDLPVYYIYDTLIGSPSAIWTLPTMTEGSIQTVAGSVNSSLKVYDHNGGKQLPAASPVMEGQIGWSPFLYTGQTWKLHPTGGINCYLYSYNRSRPQFTISNWATTWQNSEETSEFFKSNGVKYQEAQHYLRIKGGNAFVNILLPFLKGTAPYNKSINTHLSGKLNYTSGNRSSSIENGYFQESGPDYGKYIIWRNNFSVANSSVAFSGGPVWIQWESGLLRIRVHGATGKRQIRLPLRGLKPKGPAPAVLIQETNEGSTLNIEYKSKGLDLLPTQNGYMEYTFSYKN